MYRRQKALLNQSTADILSEMILLGRLYGSMQVRAVVLTYSTVLTISQTQTFKEATFNSGQTAQCMHRN